MSRDAKSPTYLRCTDSKNNHYKYYKMIPINDVLFKVEYGREGSSPQVRTYDMSEWDKKYREKINKGYEDKTEHFCLVQTDVQDITKTDSSGQKYKEIAILEVREIVKNLQEYSNNIIKTKYQINSEHVTQKMNH